MDFENGEGDQGYREWAWYYDVAKGRDFMSRLMIFPDGEVSERCRGLWAVCGFSTLGKRDWNADGTVGEWDHFSLSFARVTNPEMLP